ncbi:hypothetical protein PF66_01362 [Pseudomonas asplenii]|uniref:Uncharacterized protein n=1 Tax=Pseudomonas asplenii TaxID=53407 RepID=A0A0N0E4X6_9PSED|nr:hypothetical protein [Pseudomonas fuscovaginae]KPA91781.1 hypothetical protein PF66_01362 [Pseudomonas fuscovaginae]
MPLPPFNPFARGFSDLRIQRLLAILYDVEAPLSHLPLHPSQGDLADDQPNRRPCLFNNEHAWVLTAQAAPEEQDAHYPYIGAVVQVIYALLAHDRQPPVLLGDFHSRAIAQQRSRQLAFETGHYSRCWEINSAHLRGPREPVNAASPSARCNHPPLARHFGAQPRVVGTGPAPGLPASPGLDADNRYRCRKIDHPTREKRSISALAVFRHRYC